jgi:alpha-L-fucosidase 2
VSVLAGPNVELHHNADIWGDAIPIDGARFGIWPMGAAWLSLHLADHYHFTRDRKFLAQRAYPVMKEAAQFFLDYGSHGASLNGGLRQCRLAVVEASL